MLKSNNRIRGKLQCNVDPRVSAGSLGLRLWENPKVDDRDRQISYDITYMQNLKKMVQMNLFTK